MRPTKPHDSMRGYFAYYLYLEMEKNPDIYIVVGDLGFGMFDAIKVDFEDRFINTGAAEQAMMGIAVGLAMSGKIPVVYSITSFLLYRAFETIRNYIDYENIPVKLIGGGRDRDYAHDGISHWSEDAIQVLDIFKNIKTRWPKDKEDILKLVPTIINSSYPCFVSLRR